jgi:ribonuclease
MAIAYYIWGPHGKQTFQVDNRLDEIQQGMNPHPHYRNYSAHQGQGGPGSSYIQPHLEKDGYVHQLPANGGGYWTEVVWNRAGLPAGCRRVILGNGGEIYLTTDHYHTYSRVFKAEGQATHTTFKDSGSIHTKFD